MSGEQTHVEREMGRGMGAGGDLRWRLKSWRIQGVERSEGSSWEAKGSGRGEGDGGDGELSLESEKPGFQFSFCHLLSEWPCASDFTFLGLSFLVLQRV